MGARRPEPHWRAGDGSDDELPGNWSIYSSRTVTLALVRWLERECPGWEKHDFDVKNHSNTPKAKDPTQYSYAKYAYKLCVWGKAISRMHSKLAKLRAGMSAPLTQSDIKDTWLSTG